MAINRPPKEVAASAHGSLDYQGSGAGLGAVRRGSEGAGAKRELIRGSERDGSLDYLIRDGRVSQPEIVRTGRRAEPQDVSVSKSGSADY